jgi:hypothetical protein
MRPAARSTTTSPPRPSYTVTADGATNTAAAQLVVSLTNTAPSAGEPDYVIGNLIGLPDGSNRTWVSIYSRLPVTDVRLDDRPVAVEIGREAGYFVTSAFVTLGPGETTTLSVRWTAASTCRRLRPRSADAPDRGTDPRSRRCHVDRRRRGHRASTSDFPDPGTASSPESDDSAIR